MENPFYDYLKFLDWENVKYRASTNDFIGWAYTHRIEIEDALAFIELWKRSPSKVDMFTKWARECIAFTYGGCRVVAILPLREIEEVKQAITELEADMRRTPSLA